MSKLPFVQELDRLADALADLQALVNRADSKIARELDVGQAHDLQTLRLVNAASALKVSEIARRQAVSNATASARIDRLERRGFVERLRHDTDRRVVLVHLTETGRSAARKSVRLRRKVLAQVHDPVGAADAIDDLLVRYRVHLGT